VYHDRHAQHSHSSPVSLFSPLCARARSRAREIQTHIDIHIHDAKQKTFNNLNKKKKLQQQQQNPAAATYTNNNQCTCFSRMTDINGEADFRNVQNGRVPAPAGGSGLRTHTNEKKKGRQSWTKKTTVVCRKETIHEFYILRFLLVFLLCVAAVKK